MWSCVLIDKKRFIQAFTLYDKGFSHIRILFLIVDLIHLSLFQVSIAIGHCVVCLAINVVCGGFYSIVGRAIVSFVAFWVLDVGFALGSWGCGRPGRKLVKEMLGKGGCI